MTSPNGLVCFTNCLIPLEDGSLVEKDLWIDERRGVILNAQVSWEHGSLSGENRLMASRDAANVLRPEGAAGTYRRPRRQHHQVLSSSSSSRYKGFTYLCSPGFLDIQINGAYGFDFSVYEGDDEQYRKGLLHVSKSIVETGVTS